MAVEQAIQIKLIEQIIKGNIYPREGGTLALMANEEALPILKEAGIGVAGKDHMVSIKEFGAALDLGGPLSSLAAVKKWRDVKLPEQTRAL